jgi:hypothetical protein
LGYPPYRHLAVSEVKAVAAMRVSASICAATALALALGAAAPAAAQGNGNSNGYGAWQHTFATYLMAAGMDGKVGIGPLSADAHLDFSDLVDQLKLGMMVAYAAQSDSWTLGVDAIYMNLEASKIANAGVSFDSEATQRLLSVDGAYRLGPRFEVLAGLRYNALDADVTVAGLPGGSRAAGRSESWIDPYVGGRYTLPFADRWTFTLRADVGGFGVGSDSAWQFVSRFNWSTTPKLDVLFGYRIIDVDYDDGEGADRFLYDVRSSGPVIGAAYHY